MYAIQKTAITLMLLVFTAAFSGVSMAGGDNGSKAAPMKFVGTYYSLGGAVTTFHSDGTLSNVSSAMFSDSPDSAYGGRKVTGAKGVWRVVGKNTIRQTYLRFATEAFGHNYQPGGVILKISWEAVFDKPVQGRSPGYHIDTVNTEVFFPDQNPITDEAILVIETAFDKRAMRLEAE